MNNSFAIRGVAFNSRPSHRTRHYGSIRWAEKSTEQKAQAMQRFNDTFKQSPLLAARTINDLVKNPTHDNHAEAAGLIGGPILYKQPLEQLAAYIPAKDLATVLRLAEDPDGLLASFGGMPSNVQRDLLRAGEQTEYSESEFPFSLGHRLISISKNNAAYTTDLLRTLENGPEATNLLLKTSSLQWESILREMTEDEAIQHIDYVAEWINQGRKKDQGIGVEAARQALTFLKETSGFESLSDEIRDKANQAYNLIIACS